MRCPTACPMMSSSLCAESSAVMVKSVFTIPPRPAQVVHRLLSFLKVSARLFVLAAHELDEFLVGQEAMVHLLRRPGAGVGFRIVDRDFDFHVAEIHAAK